MNGHDEAYSEQSPHAGPSRPPRKPEIPFVAANYRPSQPDGILRVVLVSTGSVASIKIPDIVGALCLDPDVAVQVVATASSTHFYTQEAVDEAVRAALDVEEMGSSDMGVKVWTDKDEWSDWRKVGEPILHIELRRWADLVVVAPCSADILAKIAGGHCDNLALSLLRALPSTTPVILCPAMNTAMYAHKFTAKHLRIVQEELEYMVLGPQGAGKLACGDEGPGKMTDWREIVSTIQDFAAAFRARTAAAAQSDNRPFTKRNESRTAIAPSATAKIGAIEEDIPPTGWFGTPWGPKVRPIYGGPDR